MSKTVEVKHNVYTFTWWVKWVSSIIILFAMMIRASQLSPFIDSILSFIGCLGWLVVGLRWRDRAIIILNTAAVIILALGIINHFVGIIV